MCAATYRISTSSPPQYASHGSPGQSCEHATLALGAGRRLRSSMIWKWPTSFNVVTSGLYVRRPLLISQHRSSPTSMFVLKTAALRTASTFVTHTSYARFSWGASLRSSASTTCPSHGTPPYGPIGVARAIAASTSSDIGTFLPLTPKIPHNS